MLIIPLDQEFLTLQVFGSLELRQFYSLKFSHLWICCETLQDEKIALNFYYAGTIEFHYTALNYLYSGGPQVFWTFRHPWWVIGCTYTYCTQGILFHTQSCLTSVVVRSRRGSHLHSHRKTIAASVSKVGNWLFSYMYLLPYFELEMTTEMMTRFFSKLSII